jgi:hypothetical protein
MRQGDCRHCRGGRPWPASSHTCSDSSASVSAVARPLFMRRMPSLCDSCRPQMVPSSDCGGRVGGWWRHGRAGQGRCDVYLIGM